MNDKKDQKDIRKVFHVSISESEKDQVRKIAKESNMSISEFIRQSIFDKISRIKNPELDKSSTKDDSLVLEYLRKHDKRLLAMEKILRERFTYGKIIKKQLNNIGDELEGINLDKETKVVINALKEIGKPCRPIDIKEITNLSVADIYKVIGKDSKNPQPKLDYDFTNGRIELKNE